MTTPTVTPSEGAMKIAHEYMADCPDDRDMARLALAIDAHAADHRARLAACEEALRKIANAPAVGPNGGLYYEVTSEDGQVGALEVDPLGWIASAAASATAALKEPSRG